MKAEKFLNGAHGVWNGKLLCVVCLDTEAILALGKMTIGDTSKIPDWFKLGNMFEANAIQTPGRPPQGTMWLTIATTDPDWFVAAFNANPGGRS